MKPSELSKELHRISSMIEGSANPSKKVVAKELRTLVAALETGVVVKSVQKLESQDGFESFRVIGTFEGEPVTAFIDFQDNQVVQSRLEPDNEDLSDRMVDANAWEELEEACVKASS